MMLTFAVAVAGLTAFAPAASAYLYWTDNGPGLSSTGTTIGRANLDGSGVASSLVTTSPGPGGIVTPGFRDRALDPPAGLEVVICRATTKLDFSHTPLAWGVFWTPTVHAQAEALPPPFRQ